MAGELAGQLDSVEKRLSELEEERLFSGRFDAGGRRRHDHAGAGGTDSQDWGRDAWCACTCAGPSGAASRSR